MPVRETMLAFLDIETTGLEPGTDEVTEIAIILTDFRMHEIDRFEAKIKTEKIPPPHVAKINGWDAAVWAEQAVDFGNFSAWLGGQIQYGEVAVIVGANPTFDRQMIEQKYYKPFRPVRRDAEVPGGRGWGERLRRRDLGDLLLRKFLPLSHRTIDVCALGNLLRIADVIEAPDCKLATIAKALGISYVAHRAMGDVLASMEILRRTIGLLRSGAPDQVVDKSVAGG